MYTIDFWRVIEEGLEFRGVLQMLLPQSFCPHHRKLNLLDLCKLPLFVLLDEDKNETKL